MVKPDSFFTRFFPGEEDDAYLAYHRLLNEYLPARGRVLDLGCGDHRMLACYRNAEREIWGADFRQHARLTERQWFRSLPPSGTVPFADSFFDVIVSSWVLEHVTAPGAFLSEVSRVLRPGGWFVALTINGWHYTTWIRRAASCLPHRFSQRLVYRLYRRSDEDTFRTWYRLNTAAQMKVESQSAGLELRAIHRVANQGYFAFLRPLWKLAVVADYCFDRINPALGRIYLIATWRKPDMVTAARNITSAKAA